MKILYDTEVTDLVLENGVVREIHGTSHGFPLTLRARAVVVVERRVSGEYRVAPPNPGARLRAIS